MIWRSIITLGRLWHLFFHTTGRHVLLLATPLLFKAQVCCPYPALARQSSHSHINFYICQVVQLLKKKNVDFQEILRLIREGQNVNAKDKVCFSCYTRCVSLSIYNVSLNTCSGCYFPGLDLLQRADICSFNGIICHSRNIYLYV